MTDRIDYARLPGTGNSSFAGLVAYQHRAYLGPDHVLLVRRARYGETYRRLYLDDIQSVFYAETDDARTFTLGAFAGLICTAGLAFVFTQSPLGTATAGSIICAAVGAVLVVVILVNLLRGASVRCWVRTTGGETLVANVGRLRTARRFAQAIEEAVSMRQGVADRDSIETHLDGLHAPLAGEGAVATNPARTRRLPWLMLFAEAGYAGLTMAMPNVFPPGIWILFTVVAWAVVLMAVFRDTRQRLYFPYRALITVTGYYITARSLYWALYWFLLTMEGTIVFEIAQRDLMMLGGATIVVNVILASLGFALPASRTTRPIPAAVSETVTPDEDEV